MQPMNLTEDVVGEVYVICEKKKLELRQIGQQECVGQT